MQGYPSFVTLENDTKNHVWKAIGTGGMRGIVLGFHSDKRELVKSFPNNDGGKPSSSALLERAETIAREVIGIAS